MPYNVKKYYGSTGNFLPVAYFTIFKKYVQNVQNFKYRSNYCKKKTNTKNVFIIIQ